MDLGLGMWAADEKATGALIGLLYHDDWPVDEHRTEVGWLLERYRWNSGLATEGVPARVTVSRSSD